MSEMKVTIRAVTDEEVEDLKNRAAAPTKHSPDGVGLHNYHVMAGPYVVRIDSDRQLIRELCEALEKLVKVNEDWNSTVQQTIGRPPTWTDGYLDAAREVLQKARAAGVEPGKEQGRG